MDNFIYESKINKTVCEDIYKYYLDNENKHLKTDFNEEVKT